MVRYRQRHRTSCGDGRTVKETCEEEDENLNRKDGEMRTLLRKIKYWKFKRVFGFVPIFGSALVTEAEQRIVNEKLVQLAAAYRLADRNERLAVSSLRKITNAEELLAGRENLGWYQDALRRAKVNFWHAWRLAKKAGFLMSQKYTDYLPSPWR